MNTTHHTGDPDDRAPAETVIDPAASLVPVTIWPAPAIALVASGASRPHDPGGIDDPGGLGRLAVGMRLLASHTRPGDLVLALNPPTHLIAAAVGSAATLTALSTARAPHSGPVCRGRPGHRGPVRDYVVNHPQAVTLLRTSPQIADLIIIGIAPSPPDALIGCDQPEPAEIELLSAAAIALAPAGRLVAWHHTPRTDPSPEALGPEDTGSADADPPPWLRGPLIRILRAAHRAGLHYRRHICAHTGPAPAPAVDLQVFDLCRGTDDQCGAHQ